MYTDYFAYGRSFYEISSAYLEDVLVRDRKFYSPVDFIVLDMEEDSQIPTILCRPFLCTGYAIIDVKSGSLT